MRVALFNVELSREGPGLLLRDILRGDDPQVDAVVAALAEVDPDIVLLLGIDYDLENRALAALADAIPGKPYPHRFALRPNTGMATGLDLDGDGETGGPDDAQGFGEFSGMGGMAILSRHPIRRESVREFTALLWRDLPGNLYPQDDDGPFGGEAAAAIQRLSSKGHWLVPVDVPGMGTITVMAWHATPPVFDGPEDRNGRRNHDEAAFWLRLFDEEMGARPEAPFILMGDANADPARGEGRKEAITALLAHPALQDPFPDAPTVTWNTVTPPRQRVDYLLPSSDWRVVDRGVLTDSSASRHSFLWVELDLRDP